MKKMSKILAVVLCLAMAISVLAVGAYAAECPLVEGTGYKITANNANGALWLSNTITSGRFDCTTVEEDATVYYVEAVTGGYLLYFMNGEAKTYIAIADKAAGGSHVTDAASATILEWNADLNTLVVAEDSNNRAFGAGATSTYENFSAYDASQTNYNWGQYIAQEGSSPVVPDVPDVPDEPETPDTNIVDIKTALAGAKGDAFTVKGVVTCIDSSNIYVQDATGAICVRMAEKPTDIALGDTIIGTGTKDVYNGLHQLGSSTYEKSEGLTLSAKEVTLGSLSVEDVCGYVKISGLTVTEVFDNNGQYALPNVTLTDGENEIELYKAVVDGLKVGDVIDITCALSYYAKGETEKFQLRNTLASEITNVVDIPGGDEGGDNTDTPDDGEQGGEQNPETSDVSILAAVVIAACATTGLVVVTKKEQF